METKRKETRNKNWKILRYCAGYL